MARYVCIHGHFYQPPRENPWLEAIELQDSAYPYHDWNERITAECYGQNAASRILDANGRIAHVVNNYARISFNVGPTLLAWMRDRAPETYQAILDADADSRARFGGHGSALAQAYNHLIMPLASSRDRRTQIVWGIADFEHRFGRPPEGMWLPEAAVDVASLELLAEHGIAFTILEPHQARRVRRIGTKEWVDVSVSDVDTTQPYRVRLPSGADLSVFFYDGAISRAVAFEGLLRDGKLLADRLVGAFDPSDPDPQLVNIATDGESYGHHHRHGDMALAFALHELDVDPDVTLTNYGEHLERHPPAMEVEIREGTSWSCSHGIERWRSDCGCADGGHPDWNQAWRQPVREALDRLRDDLEPRYERVAAKLLRDPWAARDAYVDVVLDRRAEVADRFLEEHAEQPLDPEERIVVWKLLELQRHAMLMFTSCGWFFDDLGRIETVQVLRYAGRALQLAGELFDDHPEVERRFLARLSDARSNDPAFGDGRRVWEEHVVAAAVDVHKVAADHAVRSLFDHADISSPARSHDVHREVHHTAVAGDARLDAGRMRVRSRITEEEALVDYGVLHLGDHNIDGGVRDAGDDLDELVADLHDAFRIADFPETIRRLDRWFGTRRYSLSSLFRDEQRQILRVILDSSIEDARATYRGIFRSRAPLMRYLTDLGVRLPRTFQRAAEVVVNDDLQLAFEDDLFDIDRVRGLFADAEAWGIELDTVRLAHALNQRIARLTRLVARELPDPTLFEHFGTAERTFVDQAVALIGLAEELPFEVDLWEAQNLFHDTLQRVGPDLATRASAGDRDAKAWVEHLRALGDALSLAVELGP